MKNLNILFNIGRISFVLVSFLSYSANGQNLQQVTDNGSLTSNSIIVSTVSTTGSSFPGVNTPVNISSLNGLRINGTIGNASHNGITYQGGGGGGAAIGFFRGGSYDAGIDFYTSSESGPGGISHRMRIASNGNVGIGTTDPQSQLHVNGSQMLNGNLVFGADETAFFIKGPANGGAIRIRSNGSSSSDRDVQFGNINNNGAWSSFMTVAQNGFVGVGTNNPIGKFHVSGNAFIGNNNLVMGSTGSFVQIDQGAAEDNTYSQIRAFSNGGNTFSDLALQNGGGNVGIGTTDPRGYKLAVNGKIRAQEIKVEASPWPDYVFAKEYQLLTLQETEKHIKEKGHLPGIPSAEEVKANGIDLGEMNAKLLQKIEELTLHLIEMKKENDSQRKINEDQSKKLQMAISVLESKLK